METVCIEGVNIKIDEIVDILKKHYQNKNVICKDMSSESSSNKLESDIFVYKNIPSDIERSLRKKLEIVEKKYKESEESASKALVSIQTFHKQQQALYDEFVLLRHRYDEQKNSSVNILWTHCSKYHPDLRQIPNMESTDFIETDEKIGDFIVGDLLGEGQFATVKTCLLRGNDKEYALKIINKDRITTFNSLMRVSDEIDNLKILRSPYVISISHVIHTETNLYIITEKGGRDLFDFFDEHPDGVPETWAKQIISCILKGVMFCHDHHICHRDLKPENILLVFDQQTGICKDLKLCDFGLSTKFKTNGLLKDFCGSPGFFAPEMIMHGTYYGDKADVWSIGCILLELVAGHEKFCDIWMSAYDYEILQNKDKFSEAISETVQSLPDVLNFSTQLNSFILEFLELHSSKRSSISRICANEWVFSLMEDTLAERTRKLSFDTEEQTNGLYIASPASSSANLMNGYHTSIEHKKGGATAGGSHQVDPNIVEIAFNNVSDRERKHMAEYIQNHKDDPTEIHHMHLPPIMPATPNIVNAKKILRKGNEIANTNFNTHSNYSSPISIQSFSPGGVGNSNSNRSGGGGSSSGYLGSPLPGVKESYEGAIGGGELKNRDSGDYKQSESKTTTAYESKSAEARLQNSHSNATIGHINKGGGGFDTNRSSR